MSDLFDNPLGTDGFEFVEFTGPDPGFLRQQLEQLGFEAVGRHRNKNVTHYRQGGINFILNAEPASHAANFAAMHGHSVNALAFRVLDAGHALEQAVKRGARAANHPIGPMELNIPAIEGVGGSLIYLVDRDNIYDIDFTPLQASEDAGVGLTYIDHLTHNLYRGNMDKWTRFYEEIFNFREIRYFDIEGQATGLVSRAMTSPCGKIRIPLNESQDDQSQIEEFLARYRGEGIQHIALGTDDIYATVRELKDRGVPFQDTPDAYFDAVDTRVPGHGEDVDALRALRVLIDGAPTDGQGLLLQIFTQDAVGPIFFEIIQRKGNEGFGEGNFQALFESIELDQIRRGVVEGGDG
jgi:4-hydroxyphenylpyruvate dioxygenase